MSRSQLRRAKSEYANEILLLYSGCYKRVVRAWDDMRASKWWQNFHFKALHQLSNASVTLCSWLVMLISAVNVPVDECESTQLFWSLLCAQASTCVCVCISLRDVSGCVGRCLIAQMGLLLLVFGLSRSDAVEQKHSPRVQIHYPPLDLHLRLSLMLNCRQKPWPGVNTHALTHWAAVFIRFMSVFLIFCSFSSVNNITIILSFILG